MRILLDENVDFRLKAALSALGHDVTAIGADYPRSLRDQEVLHHAVAENRLLITNDRDFGELLIRNQSEHRGVLYLRLTTVDLADVLARTIQALSAQPTSAHDFLIVTDQRIRRREMEDARGD